MKISTHPDPNRINGLIGEDRIRTTGMFLKGNVAWRPTDPIDISPEADLIQGLPTHVKITKQEYSKKTGKPIPLRVDMACAYRLFSLKGHQRLLIMVYEEEYYIHPETGKRFKVLRFDKIIEIILSDETLAAFRGGIPVMEIERLRAVLLQWNPDVSSEEEAARAREEASAKYKVMTDAMRDRQGIAHPSNKLSMNYTTLKPDNKRVQCSISVDETREQVEAEDEGHGKGRYVGRVAQDRYIEHTEESGGFHGLGLPWRTTAKWKQIPKKGKVAPDLPKVDRNPVRGPDDVYTDEWVGVAQREIPGGTLMIMRHEDGMRTFHARSAEGHVLEHVNNVCRRVGGRLLERSNSWLLGKVQAIMAVKSLDPQELPPMPSEPIMKRLRKDDPNLMTFMTRDGPINPLRMRENNWVVMPGSRHEPDRSNQLLRIEAACRAHGVGSRNEYKGKWNRLIPFEPPELMERVAAAIRDFDHMNEPAPWSDGG